MRVPWRRSLTTLVLLAYVILGSQPVSALTGQRPISTAALPDAAVLHALFPRSVPAIPYTLYRYSGSLDHAARVVAQVTAGSDYLVVVEVSSKPHQADTSDPQGELELASLRRDGATLQVTARSGLSADTELAGSLASVKVASHDPTAADIGLRYSYALSGSGALTTSYLRVYRRQAAVLFQVLAVQTDQHISVGACCRFGQTAALSVLQQGNSPHYGVQLAGYSQSNSRTDRYILPGTIRYVQSGRTYRADRLVLAKETGYALARTPILASLPAATMATLLGNSAAMYLPGAISQLSIPGKAYPSLQLFTGWSTKALTVVVRTLAAWPTGVTPTRLDLYLAPYNGRPLEHLVFSAKQASCMGGQGYGAQGYQCQLNISASVAWGRAIQSSRSTSPTSIHHYQVKNATRIALVVTGTSQAGVIRASLDPATTDRISGTMTTLLALSPAN